MAVVAALSTAAPLIASFLLLSGVLMSSSTTGLFAGLLLALIAALAGFGWFLLAILFAAVGYLIGAHLEGRINLAGLIPGRSRG